MSEHKLQGTALGTRGDMAMPVNKKRPMAAGHMRVHGNSGDKDAGKQKENDGNGKALFWKLLIKSKID